MSLPRSATPHLRALPALAGLSDGEIAIIGNSCKFRTFAPGKAVITEDHLAQHAYVLVTGVLNHEGAALGRVVEGTLFGEIGVFDSEPYHRLDSLVANSEVLVLEIPFSALQIHADKLWRTFYSLTVRYLKDRVKALKERHHIDRRGAHEARTQAGG
jgi:signal-transduction protein with cAMP-binding, CBS, and nucleotidyltransferase domain